MCVAIPGRVIAIHGNEARIEVGGNVLRADVSLVDEMAVGDYALIHAGFAIQKLDRADAEERLALFGSMEMGFRDDAKR